MTKIIYSLFLIAVLFQMNSFGDTAPISERAKFSGQMDITGQLKLNARFWSSKSLSSGSVQVEISGHDYSFYRMEQEKDRQIKLITEEGEFKFKVPSALISYNRISLDPKSADQTAHLTADLQEVVVSTEYRMLTNSCTYTGTCSVCDYRGMKFDCAPKFSHRCTGLKPAIFKFDKVAQKLSVQIYSDTGSATINTDQRTITKERLFKVLEKFSCEPIIIYTDTKNETRVSVPYQNTKIYKDLQDLLESPEYQDQN